MAYGFNNSKSKVEVQEKKVDITAQTTYLGSATKIPMIQYDSQGHITKTTSVDIYPPTSAGQKGQIWESDGAGAGTWMSKDTAPTSGSSNVVTSGGVYTELSKKAASSHTHDDRYYTESEMNTKLAGKSDSSHTHDERYYTETEVNNLLAKKSDTGHTHSDYATKTEVNAKQDKITISTADPSGGSDGDIWLKYE